MNNNYMIAVDENGTPYIAHADGLFSKVRQKGAKYYQKIKTAWGTRYFYDPEEWEAYVQGKGDKPQSAVGKIKDKLGFDERARRNAAADRSANSNLFNRGSRERALNKAQSAYDQTALGRAENAINRARDAFSGIGGHARKTVDRARDYAQTTLGSIREGTLKQAQETISNAGKTISEASAKIQSGAQKLIDNAQITARKIGGSVQDVYEFGKAYSDNAKAAKEFNAAKDTMDKISEERGTLAVFTKEYREARDVYSGAIDKIKDSCDRMDNTKVGQNLNRLDKSLKSAIDSVKDAADDAKRAISDLGDTIRNAPSTIANRADSRDEKAALDEAQKAYDRVRGTGSDVELEAYWNLMNAQNAYNKTYGAQARAAASTVASRASTAATSARDAISGAADRARGAVDNAREAVSGAAGRARDTIGNAAESARGAVSNAASRVGEAAGRARDAVTGGVSDAITRAREEAAEVADRTYAREAKAAYDAAAREYEKVRGSGSDVELEAYWNMMNAQQALDRARGILG